jgi:hypothetical protein
MGEVPLVPPELAVPPEAPVVCVRPPLLAPVPPVLRELSALVPPLRLLEDNVEPPLAPPWLPPRPPPALPELALDDPPASLLLTPPDEPALDPDELDELLLDEPPLPWLPPEFCVRTTLLALLLPPLEPEDPPVALCEPVSSLQLELHTRRTVRAVARIRMAAPYCTSSGKKPAGNCSVR